jgi:hypothetical protein
VKIIRHSIDLRASFLIFHHILSLSLIFTIKEQHAKMFFYCFFDFWGKKIGGNGALQTVLKREKSTKLRLGN